MFRAALILALALLATATPAAAQGTLRPGEYRWYESADRMPVGTRAGVSITISIPQQMAFVYRDGMMIGVSTVSTGRDGKETPTGEFTILQKKQFHRSNLYSNAPMPWMQRLTWDGIALHAGHLPGYPASHGCIRFPAAFAKRLYALTDLGASVSIVDYPVDEPFDEPAPAPVLYADTSRLGGEGYDLVTMSSVGPMSGHDESERHTPSWVMGPAREIVQPLPASRSER